MAEVAKASLHERMHNKLDNTRYLQPVKMEEARRSMTFAIFMLINDPT